MVCPTTAADGVLLERAEPGCGLAGVEDRRAGACDRIHVTPSQGRDAGKAAEHVQRQPLAAEESSPIAFDAGNLPLRLVAVRRDRLEPDGRVELGEDGVDKLEAADDAALLEQERRFGRDPFGYDRLARQVAGAEVLGEPRADVDGRQFHASKTAPRPGRRTVCRPWSSESSCGKSARKWPPRLSVRVSALRATRLATGCDEPTRPSSPAPSRTSPASRHIALRRAAVTGGEATGLGGRSRTLGIPGSGADATAERRPKTRHSSIEFEASLFAP